MLPTVISLSKTLARLAIDLDKRPELVAHLTQRNASAGGDEATERVTLVESSANVIREGFKKCLSERSGPPSGVDVNGKPEGRRIGIYLTANLCLKLFFHCRKLRSAEQIFGNIYQQSPPLSLFPASQRVTFLYYLGRYLFANNHFFRAQLALQAAFNQCHTQFTAQRRLILIYLMTANIVLGRFPSARLYQLPEAAGLQERFGPLCLAISKGDLCTFRRFVDLESEHADWFLRKRTFLQISNRCEVLVWRSLARRTFLLSGSSGDATKRTAPTLRLEDILILATSLETKALLPSTEQRQNLERNGSILNSGIIPQSGSNPSPFNPPRTSSPLSQPPQTANEDAILQLPAGHIDPDFVGVIDEDDSPPLLPTIESIESIAASLVEQDLIHGFISHAQHRIAITGAKQGNPLYIGFPKVWDVIKARADTEVPGWVRDPKREINGVGAGGPRRAGPGMVVNLSGARPVGVAPG